MARGSKEYLLARVEIDSSTGCWRWKLSANPQTGYGQIGFYPYTAHRLSFSLFVTDPGEEVVRHQCHNRLCCNPDHLLIGSYGDNYWDSRETHLAAAETRRGRPPANRIAVTVGGRTFASKSEAMAALHVSPSTLARIAD